MDLMIHVSCVVAEISEKFMRRMRLNLCLSVVEKLLLELRRLMSQVREALPKRVLVKISGAEMNERVDKHLGLYNMVEVGCEGSRKAQDVAVLSLRFTEHLSGLVIILTIS